MKILLNSKNLVPDNSWHFYRKVRAVIENSDGQIAISSESDKYIFPGGKCELNEDNLSAIQREIKEEMGIILSSKDFKELFELETLYDNVFDYRTNSITSRHTITTYYYVKTDQVINKEKMSLTEDEIEKDFKIFFVDKETLLKMLKEEHKEAVNWHLFYDENKVVVDYFLNKNNI